MKSCSKCICAVILCSFLFPLFAFAASSEEYADKLNKLGLFQGTDQGFDLDEPLTREQSATMLVRLLGKEDEAKSDQNFQTVFEDVSEKRWSFPYVMYCYEQDITKGTSSNTFSPDKEISAAEFITLVLRLLGYKDTAPETAFEEAVNISLINSNTSEEFKNSEEFLREDMVYIVYRSLKTKTSEGDILARKLEADGVLTEQEADEFDIYKSAESFDDILEDLFMTIF